MESIGCEYTTTLTLPNTMTQLRHYPAHDPHLSQYLTMINQHKITNKSIEGYRNPHFPPIECRVEITETLPEPKTAGEGDEQVPPEILYTTEFGSPDGQIQLEFRTTDDPESNSQIRTADRQHMTRPHPKRSAYLLGVYLAFLGLVLLKLTQESHTHFPTSSPFIVISTVAYAMAFLDLCIWSWIHERLHNQNSSNQHVYLTPYKILKDVYYILCILAFVLLLPVLLASQPPSIFSPPPPPPPPPPPHHPYRHH